MAVIVNASARSTSTLPLFALAVRPCPRYESLIDLTDGCSCSTSSSLETGDCVCFYYSRTLRQNFIAEYKCSAALLPGTTR